MRLVPGPSVSVLVVSWQSAAWLERCLTAIDPGEAEIIVADNASSDGSAALARTVAPHATVLALDRNLGFAGGVNAARARPDAAAAPAQPRCGADARRDRPARRRARPGAGHRRRVEGVGQPGDGARRRGGVGVEQQQPGRVGGARAALTPPAKPRFRSRAITVACGATVRARSALPSVEALSATTISASPGLMAVRQRSSQAADCQLTTRTDTDGPGTGAL